MHAFVSFSATSLAAAEFRPFRPPKMEAAPNSWLNGHPIPQAPLLFSR
jgi:hypothetical protein